jgi:polysaccharide biosynthesis transport protein
MVERPTSEGLFAAVRRRLGLALLCTLLVPAAAYGLSKTVDPEYTASASLLFQEPPLQRGFAGSSIVILDSEARRKLLTNVELASLDVVAQRTARRLGGGVTAEQVSADVGISTIRSADVAVVDARAHTGELAAQLANAFAREFIAFRRKADLRRVRRAQRRLEREIEALERGPAVEDRLTRRERGTRRRSLRRRARSLELLAAVQTGGAELVEPAAVPSSPSSPKTRTNVAVGAAVGLLLGLSLALFVDRLDRRLRSPREAERAFGRPIVGSIPRSGALSAKRDQVRLLPPAELEAFHSLRANLTHFNADQELRSVLVTSPAPGDGRTTTAWHLAVAAAETGARVLLLEADLRRPRLQHMLGLADGRSLVQVLTTQQDFFREVHWVKLPGRTGWRGNGGAPQRAVDVIPAGPLPPDPLQLLASERMRDLMRAAQERYELVIIDAPPLLAVADAVPLLPEVSGALVVVRIGHTGRGDTLRLAERLRNLRARPLGVVANQSERGEPLYRFSAEEPVPGRLAIRT